MCARLLKAKYYPNGEFIDIVFLSDASPTWRAIKHGVALLKRGIIWRIGSRTKVQIWRDSRIPRPPFLKINGRKDRGRLRWVSQLMVPGRCEWDMNVLRSCLLPHDVEEVRKICLSDRITEDVIAWNYERMGVFSVKSAYKLALQIENKGKWNEGSVTMSDGRRPLYKEVWNTRALCVFAWRLDRKAWLLRRIGNRENCVIQPSVKSVEWRMNRVFMPLSLCALAGNEGALAIAGERTVPILWLRLVVTATELDDEGNRGVEPYVILACVALEERCYPWRWL
jgi:hypothetical protein